MAAACRCPSAASLWTNAAPTRHCGWQGITRGSGTASSNARCAATGRTSAVPFAPTRSGWRSVAATTTSTSSSSPQPATWPTAQVRSTVCWESDWMTVILMILVVKRCFIANAKLFSYKLNTFSFFFLPKMSTLLCAAAAEETSPAWAETRSTGGVRGRRHVSSPWTWPHLQREYTLTLLTKCCDLNQILYCWQALLTVSVTVVSHNATHSLACLCSRPVSSKKIHFFASFPGSLTGKVNRIKYSKVLVNVGRAYNRRTGVFKAPVKGIYQFFFSSQSGRRGQKTDLWLVVNNYWVAVSHTHVSRPSTVSSLSTYMTFLRRGALVFVTQNCGDSWANAASTTITFGGSLLVQMK